MELDLISQMALKDWRALNSVIAALNEVQLTQMLEHELNTKKRHTMATRIHQKFTAMRTARERSEIILKCTDSDKV